MSQRKNALSEPCFSPEDISWMKRALLEAEKAFEEDEVPIGALITCGNRLVIACHNQVERLKDATAHAEMLALTGAMAHFGTKYLPDCTLYVTLEPCVMCMGALRWAQVGRIVFGAKEEKCGYSILAPRIAHPKARVEGGLLENECRAVMQEFFTLKGRR